MSTVDYLLKQLKSKDLTKSRTKSVSDMIVKNYVGHEWQLKKYPTLKESEYESPCFSAPESRMTWYITFQPRVERNKQDHIRVSLNLKSYSEPPRVYCNIKVLDVDGNVRRSEDGLHDFSDLFFVFLRPNRPLITVDILKSEISIEKKTLSSDGTLTLACDIFEVTEYVANPSHTSLHYSTSEKKGHGLLEQLLEKHRTNAEDHVTMVGKDDVRVEASEFVLAARSEVLQAMLNTPMKERRTKVIELKDIDGEVLKRMVKFINTDTVTDLKKYAEPLLVVADRYQLIKLKMMCEEHLIQLVGLSTVSHLKSLAEMTNSSLLKKSCDIFSKDNQLPKDFRGKPSLKKRRP